MLMKLNKWKREHRQLYKYVWQFGVLFIVIGTIVLFWTGWYDELARYGYSLVTYFSFDYGVDFGESRRGHIEALSILRLYNRQYLFWGVSLVAGCLWMAVVSAKNRTLLKIYPASSVKKWSIEMLAVVIPPVMVQLLAGMVWFWLWTQEDKAGLDALKYTMYIRQIEKMSAFTTLLQYLLLWNVVLAALLLLVWCLKLWLGNLKRSVLATILLLGTTPYVGAVLEKIGTMWNNSLCKNLGEVLLTKTNIFSYVLLEKHILVDASIMYEIEVAGVPYAVVKIPGMLCLTAGLLYASYRLFVKEDLAGASGKRLHIWGFTRYLAAFLLGIAVLFTPLAQRVGRTESILMVALAGAGAYLLLEDLYEKD